MVQTMLACVCAELPLNRCHQVFFNGCSFLLSDFSSWRTDQILVEMRKLIAILQSMIAMPEYYDMRSRPNFIM
jgi:hypothetical protein